MGGHTCTYHNYTEEEGKSTRQPPYMEEGRDAAAIYGERQLPYMEEGKRDTFAILQVGCGE